MNYRIEKVFEPSSVTANNYYLILNNHNCFVAKFYSELDAEICLAALKNYGAPAEQSNNSRNVPCGDCGECSEQSRFSSKCKLGRDND